MNYKKKYIQIPEMKILTHLSGWYLKLKQKDISKDIKDLNNTVNKLYLVCIYVYNIVPKE